MRTLIKVIILFLALTGAATLLVSHTDWRFGEVDYWIRHGWMFLFFIAIFPRLTLLFSWLLFGSILPGGIVWWASFFFAPRLLVAVLATLSYWKTNPALVIMAWLIGLGGESSEKVVITKRIRINPIKTRKNERSSRPEPSIEAEYEIRD